MLGSVLRSDGRKYSEIAKAGLFWGIIFGFIGIVVSLIVGSSKPILIGIAYFISSSVCTIITFLLGAVIYDISNEFMDN